MYESIGEDAERVQEGEQDTVVAVHEMLDNFDSIMSKETDNRIPSLATTPDSSPMATMSEETDSTRSLAGSPTPSPMEIQSEIHHDKVFDDEVPKFETPNSSMECASVEVINIQSDSDDDRDYYYSDASNLNDVLIIDTVKPAACDTATLSSLLQLSDEILVEPPENLQDRASPVANSSDRRATSVSNKIQDGHEAKDEKNNNDVTYTKTVSGKWMKRLSQSPKPGCSKDSDDTFPKPVDGFPNLDELLKDAKLIHALLPRFSYRVINRTLCSNQFARNRTELTLWDLLPVERPQPQYFRKRKPSDEVCIVECKRSSNVSLQKDQVDTETAVGKKEQHVKSALVGNVEKLENRLLVPSTGEIEVMNKNVPECTVVSNDTNNDILNKLCQLDDLNTTKSNNDIDQPSTIPVEKTKLNLKTSIAAKYVENNDMDKLMHPIALNSKKSVSEVGPKTEELQSIKNSEVKKKSKPLPDNTATCPVAPVLQPAKLTLEPNFQRPSQNVEMHSKPPVPILSPPKLQIIDQHAYTYNAMSNTIHVNVKPTVQVKQHEPNYIAPNYYYPAPISPVRLLSTSSNNKEASRSDYTGYGYVLPEPIVVYPKRAVSRDMSSAPRNMETKDAAHTLASIFTANVSQYYNQPSSSTETAQNIADSQKANSSKACYNFDQEAGNASTSTTSQDHDRGDEKKNLPFTNLKHEIYDEIKKVRDDIVKDIAKNIDNKEVKTCAQQEKSKDVEKNVDSKNIILNEKANALYVKLIPMFPSVKTHYIKQLCHDYTRDYERSLNQAGIFEHLVDMLLNCGSENLKKLKPYPPPKEEPEPSYDMNEQYADLLTIFPEADPVYLRKIAEELHGDHERIKEFVQSKLEKPDYPTRTQYLAKKKITQQQKQYTTDFKVQQFLEIFPDPFSHFENDKRNCEFNPHAIDFLKYYFSKLRVNTLVKAYGKYRNNLSLTAKALEALNPDMKTKRQSNKMVLTEDIPFLQECAFIQHKAELRKYLDGMKTREEQEFNELKAKGELLECQCCYDNECMPSKCSTCEEGHIFCNSCIIRSTDVVLGDGNTSVDCLLKCGCEFPISVLQRVLPPTKFSILLCKRQEAEVIAAGVEGLVSCPFCHFASIPPPEDKIFKCLNPECMKESCRLCKEINHIPLKCNEKKAESARKYLEERMTEALVRKCYRCSRMFFKEEGCNKMTCICGAQMCYICDKPVTDYKHFQGQGAERSNLCPLWSDDRRMNAESVIKVCQETVKQIKEKDPKIDLNVDALLPKLPPKSRGPHDDIQNAMVHIKFTYSNKRAFSGLKYEYYMSRKCNFDCETKIVTYLANRQMQITIYF